MRPRVVVGALVAVVVLAAGALSGGSATYARYTDKEAKPGSVGASTVVLGAASQSPTLAFANPSASGSVSATLNVVYAGTTTAKITLSAKPATTYASNFCTYASGTGWTTKSILGIIGPSITFTIAGTQVPYCTLLNGAEVTLAASVAAGSTTSYTITATYGGLLNLLFQGKTDTVPLSLHAYSTGGIGFNATTTGTLTVSTAATTVKTNSLARVATPTTTTAAPATTTAVAAPAGTPVTSADVPAECAAAGMTAASFVEKITLTAAQPSFDATRDRPGSAGPFLVIGSSAANTIVGSAGADCLVGGPLDDVISGGAGNDVLIGGAGVDRLSGGDGNDKLYGGPGVDVLDGGPGADLLDGGADGATCATDASDTTTGCLAAVPEGAADPTSAAPTSAVVPTTVAPTTEVSPAPAAPSPAPAAAPAAAPASVGTVGAAAPVPEGAPATTGATPTP